MEKLQLYRSTSLRKDSTEVARSDYGEFALLLYFQIQIQFLPTTTEDLLFTQVEYREQRRGP